MQGGGNKTYSRTKDYDDANEPNPVSEKTKIIYELIDKGWMELTLWNTFGKKAMEIEAGTNPRGIMSLI